MYDEESVREAVKLANDKAAKILIRRGSVLATLTPDISVISRAILRHQWKPFEAYVDADGSWGLQLQADDFIVRIAMRDEETYAALHEIAVASLYDQIATPTFMKQLLERVILDGEGHDDTD